MKKSENIEIKLTWAEGSQGELIGWPCSGICPSVVHCPSTISKIFSSETTEPIKAKLHVEHHEGGTKVYINDPGHMTKMAAIPIYGKKHKKSSSLEPVDRFQRNIVCSIGDSGPS